MARDFKLNKSEFPEDYRFSRERFWVCERPGGIVRIGVALHAIQDDPPGVYFLDLRKSGFILTGKKIGFLDLDSGRFDLLAPLTGRIRTVNPAVKKDPGVIAADPYGEGWLCEVDRVLPQALNALLDRDSFFGWIRFEREARRLGIEPTLSGSHRILAGEPWPQDLVVRFGGRVIARSRPVRIGRNETFTPQWTQGQRFRVRTRFEQPSMAMVLDPANTIAERTFEYTVTDEFSEVNQELCYAVKVEEVAPYPIQSYLMLHIARSDFSLRLLEEVSAHDPTRRAPIPNDWGAETFLELRRPRELIVDLPLFPPENRDEVRTVRVGEEPELVVRARFPSPTRMEIEATGKARGEEITSRQIWERGLPWFRYAERKIGERLLIEAELLEEPPAGAPPPK